MDPCFYLRDGTLVRERQAIVAPGAPVLASPEEREAALASDGRTTFRDVAEGADRAEDRASPLFCRRVNTRGGHMSFHARRSTVARCTTLRPGRNIRTPKPRLYVGLAQYEPRRDNGPCDDWPARDSGAPIRARSSAPARPNHA